MYSSPRPRIDLLQLHYFVAVVDAGSITKASRICHIAQPALSKRIASLEEELGVQLLHRGAFGVQPTEEGSVLYSACQRVLRDFAAIPDTVRSSAENPAGEVVVCCQDSLTRLVSRPLAKHVAQNYPNIRLAASAGQSLGMYRSLGEGQIDLALLVYDADIFNVSIHLMLEEELFVVAAPSLLADKGPEISLSELASLPFVFPSSTSFASGQMVMSMLEEDNANVNVVAMVDGEALKALIVDGLGCCVLPWSFVQPEIESGEILYRPIKDTPMLRRIALCSSSDRPQSVATRTVAALMQQVIEDSLGDGTWQHARLIDFSA